MPRSSDMGGIDEHLALPEYGATRAELLSRGWSDRSIKRAIRAGRLVRIGRGWYSTPSTIWVSTMSLVSRLNPSAVFSHRTAAWLHGYRQSPPATLDVVVPRGINTLQGATVHRRDPAATSTVTVHGWRATGPAQTLADLMAPEQWGPERVAEVVDKQFPTGADRRRLLAETRQLAHSQAAELEKLLAWAPDGAKSNVERRLVRALERLGFIVVLNYRIGPYRFDLVHVEARLIIEFDSYAHHMDRESFRNDRARQNHAVRAGWNFLRYHDSDLAWRFGVVVAEIAATIRERLGGPRVESEWDHRPCWELYEELYWQAAENAAAEMGPIDGVGPANRG